MTENEKVLLAMLTAIAHQMWRDPNGSSGDDSEAMVKAHMMTIAAIEWLKAIVKAD